MLRWYKATVKAIETADEKEFKPETKKTLQIIIKQYHTSNSPSRKYE